MSRYDNIECPVCKRLFEDGDDIVVCPECGTPHHRECYNSIGHCVNRNLHKAGYSFDDDESSKGDSDDIVRVAKKILQNSGENTEEKAAVPPVNVQITPDYGVMYINDPDTIDGESVSDVAAAVRSNVPRFIRAFKKLEGKKKFTWNWSAFFFGSFYFFYRKIYRQAIMFISLGVTLLLASNFAMMKFAPKCTELFTEYANQTNASSLPDRNALAEKIMASSDYKNAVIVSAVFFGAIFILRIIEALFADRIYKSTVSSLIKRVRSRIDEGATISSPMGNESELNLSQEQMIRYYLSSKGGVSFFAPMIAFLAVQMLMRVI